MIVAHGIDLVDIAHTARLLTDPSDQFLTRCFTSQEQEAVGKALGTGFSAGVGFLSIEVVTMPSGAPTIILHGEAQRRAEMLGINSWLVSTSHEGDMAIASVIGLADQGAPR